MADRSVSVELRLRAASYLQGIQAAKMATRDLSNETLKATKQNHANLQQVGRAGLIAGGAIAAGLGLAVAASTKFDKSLSSVKAVANATSGEMNKLRQAALDAGKATIFSASESADAEGELAKAGVSVKDILGGGLLGALNLAAAGQIGVADAANIAATAMTQFGKTGKDVPHIADLLAAAANKAQGGVSDMAQALKYVGPVANQMGISIEQTVGTVAELAHAGILGDQAGTSLRGMLTALTSPSKIAAKTMESLGISVYDAAGQFVGFNGVAGQLQAKLGDLTNAERDQALGRIFGNEQITAARVLYAGGAKDVNAWTKSVNDAGAAQRIASTNMDNLAGDLEQLRGSIETALIQTGSAGNESLRSLAQGATHAVNSFSGLPGPVQKTGFYMGAFTSAALLTAGAVGTMLPKIRETRDALEAIGPAGYRASQGLGLIGKAGAVGAVAIAVGTALNFLANKITELEGQSAPGVDKMTQSLVKFTETNRLTGTSVKQIVADLNALDGVDAKIGHLASATSFGLIGRNVNQASGRIDAIDKSLAGLVGQGYGDKAAQIFKLLSASITDSGGSASLFGKKLNDYAAAAKNASTQQDLAAQGADPLATALQDVATASEDATQALKDYEGRLTDTTAIDAYTANATLAKSFRDLSKDIKTAGKVTDSEKITLGGYATDVKTAADAVFKNSLKTKSLRDAQKDANDALREGRKHFVDLAEQAGYGERAAKRLARRLIDIPKRTAPQIATGSLDRAITKATKLNALFKQLDIGPYSVPTATPGRQSGVTRASGGIIPGPPSRADTVPAMLSTGEFVVNAAATSVNRGLLEAINSGRRFADGGIVRGGPTYSTSLGRSITVQNTVVAPDPVAAGQSVSRQVQNDLWASGMLS